MVPRATIIAALLGVLSVFALGYWAGNQNVEEKVTYRTEYRERQEDVKATRDEARFATREQTVTKPDGTVVVTKRVEVVNKTETVERSEREKAQVVQRTTQANDRKPQYRLSVQVKPSDTSDVRVGLGRRLLGPVWLEGSVSKRGDVTLGLGVEF